MSDVAYQPRVKATRARTLGDAVPTFRPFRDDSNDVKIVPKSADELRADRDAARDAQPMATSCGVDGCDWHFEGTAGECRTEAASHRAAAHPELVGARTHRKGISFKRRGEEVDPAVVAESRRLRQERDDAQRLATIERGRAARGERPLEEAASRLELGAASSSSPTNGRSTVSTICKIEGCDNDAADAPKTGPTAKLCRTHRGERSAALSAERTGRPRGAAGGGAADQHLPPAPPTEPKKIVVPPGGDGGSLAELASELEDARIDVNRANTRWLDAIKAFKAHEVIQQLDDEDGIAA